MNDTIEKFKCEGKNIPELIIAKYLIEILFGIDYIHSHNLVHKNLWPNNILIDERGRIKIGDLIHFSPSKIDESNDYISPEALKGDYYPSSDIWSIGCIFYKLCCFKVSVYYYRHIYL